MPYHHRRTCPICGKQDLLKLSNHLSQVHQLSSAERTSGLNSALFTPSVPYMTSYPMTLPTRENKCSLETSQNKCLLNTVKCMETQPYPEFKFQHMFSMMVVGPSQSGKTCFVQQLLTKNCIDFPEKKPMMVYWFYNQWQPRYDDIRQALKKKIRFAQGVPELKDDLSNINPARNNIVVLDDLMSQATDSPVVSKLFTQGRHRNASVILLLQNMFPKGKFNTDISRNALYKVLFRSPGDRKQIDIMAEQTFAKDHPHSMKAYTQETEQPYGYIMLDNHPRTTSEHQVVANVFGDCYTYPHITSSPTLPQRVHERIEPSSLREQRPEPTRKRKVNLQAPPAKKRKRVQKVNKLAPAKKVKRKERKKKPRKQAPTFIKPREISEEEPSDEEQSSFEDSAEEVDEPPEEEPSEETWHYPSYQDRLIKLARPRPQGGFGPRCSYY